MEEARDPDKVHFYASSGGNAGLGCVFAAEFVGRPSTVVVPATTRPHMIAKLKVAGATQVIQHGSSIREADIFMQEVVMKQAEARGEETVYVSPFDNPYIWEGHSTMVDEMRAQFEDLGESAPDLLVCSCGGGGLFVGLMQGIENQGPEWEQTKVLVVNTVGADALARSLELGENFTLPKTTSIATSLGCARIADRAFEIAMQGKAKNAVLTDAEAVMGCVKFADLERMLVEPACGVNVALCFGQRLKRALGRAVEKDDKVVLVVCGGSNVTAGMVEEWRQELEDANDYGLTQETPRPVAAPMRH